MGSVTPRRVPESRGCPARVLPFALLATSACTSPATEVIVHLDTDAPITRSMTVTVTAYVPNQPDAGGTHTWVRGPEAGSLQLPGSFAVIPAAGQPLDALVELRVDATVESNGLSPTLHFARRARFHFTPHVTTHVPLFLSATCGTFTTGCAGGDDNCTVSQLCEEQGSTCGDYGSCIPVDVSPAADGGAPQIDVVQPEVMQPDVTPPDEAEIDAAMDVPPPCPMGETLCDGSCVDTVTDPLNCGACGTACPDRPFARTVCARSSCGIVCDPTYGDCDGNANNGCETPLNTATACGSCMVRCSGGTPICSAGTADGGAGAFTCVSGCAAGQMLCGSTCSDVATDSLNCGSCGTVCPVPAHATATCAASACGIACTSGFGNCDGTPANGCEAALQTSVANCGSCGRACSASQLCTSGACTCPAGTTNCSGACVDLHLDTNNCGTCGHVCADTCAYDGTCNSSATKRANLEALVNMDHMAAGCPSLVHDPRLELMAQHQAADMGSRHYFGTTGADGASVATRATRVGYPRLVREMYEAGSTGANGAVTQLRTLAYYTNNINDCTFVNFAVGYYYQADTTMVRDDFTGGMDPQWHHYWVLELGR